MPKCDGCPVNCLGQSSHPVFCTWWASGDANLRAHVVNRSAKGITSEPTPEVSEVQAPAPATPPGLFRKMMTGGKAVVDHVVAGLPTVDEATAQGRLAICRACPYFNADKVICNQCGCQLDIKVYWSEQACPIGRWGPDIQKS